MKRMTICILTTLLAAAVYSPCYAQEEKKTEKTTPADKDNAANELPAHLIRDPFWPVNWAPDDWGKDVDQIKKISGERKWSSARSKIKVKGISKGGGKYYATIEGQKGLQEVGSIISVTHMGLAYRWEITAIKKTGIATKKLDVTAAK